MRKFRPISKEEESVCILDWAGNTYLDGEWADYCPQSKRVVFGGGWQELPDWSCEVQPTPDETYAALEYYEEHNIFPVYGAPKADPYEIGTPLFDWRKTK